MGNQIYQFGPRVDKKLNDLSFKIGESEETIEKAESNKKTAWEEVYSFFDELPSSDDRFIASDGHTLARQKRAGGSKMNAEMLQGLIFQKYEKAEATRIWNSITVRSVDSAAVEAAVRMKKLDPAIVEQCITTNPDTFARVRPEWTKEDKERARIFGIERA